MAPVLEGVRVVELSQMIAAPLCGLTLGDMGAEVIKVEPPGGEYTRTLPPNLPSGESAYFQMLNRGKRGVELDLRDEANHDFARRLVDSADIVVESLGEGAEGAAIGYEDSSARNPKLIWCSITGYGRGRSGRTLDPALQASTGMMAMTGEPGRAPMRLPVPLVDFTTGMYAVQSVLGALLRAERDGAGALLDCAMVDAAAMLASSAGVHALSGEQPPLRRMGTENPWYVPAGNFEAADGEWVQLIAVNGQHWRALCEALGRPEWLEDTSMKTNSARLEHRDSVHRAVGEAIGGETAQHWETAITEAGGFCRRIREIEEAWSDPLVSERGLVGEMEGEDGAFPIPITSLAGRMPPGPLPAAPRLGEHNAQVAEELD